MCVCSGPGEAVNVRMHYAYVALDHPDRPHEVPVILRVDNGKQV